MTIEIGNIRTNYIQYGEGKDIVLLHGWGQNIEMMQPLGDRLTYFRITILDLPGFGHSSEPDSVWTIEDYASFLHQFLSELKIKKPIVIGHSFGGRVAICYAASYPVSKVVLFGAPCIRENQTLTTKQKFLKTVKKLPGMTGLSNFAKKHIGSTDYRQATPRMRDILVQVVNQDLSDKAQKISVPTLLIWGNQDEAAPLEDAQKLEKLLPDGGLVVLEGCTHYAYLEALNRVVSILEQFL